MENILNSSEKREIPTQVMNHILQKKIEQYSNISDYYEFFNTISEVISKIPGAVFHLYSEKNTQDNTDGKISLLHVMFAEWIKEPDTIRGDIYSRIQVVNTPIISQTGFNIIMKGGYNLGFLEIPGYHTLIERFEKNPSRQVRNIQCGVSASIENALKLCELSYRFDDAQIDLLTGLFLRRFGIPKFIKTIESQVKAGKEIGGVIMIDLDHFKNVNDTYGHDCGDEAIRYASTQIRSAISIEEDIAIRFGGEELLIYCPGKTLEETNQLACKLNRAIQNNRYQWNGEDMKITASIGVSDFSNIDSTLSAEKKMELAIRQADKAMYHVKETGRNGVYKYHTGLLLQESPSKSPENNSQGISTNQSKSPVRKGSRTKNI